MKVSASRPSAMGGATLVFALLGALTIAPGAEAQDAISVTLRLKGENFQGAPKFELRVDGTVIGSGELSVPAGTEESFSFDLPADTDPRQIGVAFTNDFYIAGQGDRNLTIVSVGVDGADYPGSALVRPTGGILVGESLRMTQGGEALLHRPPTGWHAASAAGAAANTPAASEACAVENLEIGGYTDGSPFIPSTMSADVEAFVEALATERCRFTVTGYTSSASEAARRMAGARAEEAAKLLVRLGVGKDLVAIANGGVTSQFGSPAENRRVVVSVSAE